MRNKNGQFIKGYTGNPLGRPKRADEQELLDIWDTAGREKFIAAVEQGHSWALKLLMDKLFSNRKATDVTVGVTQSPLKISFDSAFIK